MAGLANFTLLSFKRAYNKNPEVPKTLIILDFTKVSRACDIQIIIDTLTTCKNQETSFLLS